jgi:hypothetical protein
MTMASSRRDEEERLNSTVFFSLPLRWHGEVAWQPYAYQRRIVYIVDDAMDDAKLIV